jgi:hypothetical protein
VCTENLSGLIAYHLEWHMRQALAPILFDDHDHAAVEASRTSPVAKAEPLPAAERKARKKCTDDGHPVHSFRARLANLATLVTSINRLPRRGGFNVRRSSV